MSAGARLAEIARHQLGLVTRGQALAAGCSASGIRTRLHGSEWVLVRRSVYAAAGVAPTPEQAALAVCLAAGDGCWASHRTAGALWGLEMAPPAAIDVLTLPGRRLALDGVAHHRSTSLALADLTRHRRVPVTSVARTLVDCVAYLPGRRLARSVDEALRRQLMSVDQLAACTSRLDGGHGRRRLVPLRAVLADRMEGYDPGGSQGELDLVEVLVAGGLRPPQPQYRVVVGGRIRYLDYAYAEEKVGLEYDGFAHHGLIRTTFDDDRLRGNDLGVAGWLMLHFTSRSSPTHIVERTQEALALRAPRAAS
ncbi:MAG TPA: hypothetical protein VNT56_03720 [Acidimicrobiales bacterium]|nr:hypothetical protein [Acidimicrobiales bacterium]